MTSKTTKQDPVPQATENRDLEIWMRLPFADYVIKLKKMICSARERGFSPVVRVGLEDDEVVAGAVGACVEINYGRTNSLFDFHAGRGRSTCGNRA